MENKTGTGNMQQPGSPRDGVHNKLTKAEKQFLQQTNDSNLKPDLLVRLEKLGLLSAFLEAENGTS